MRTTLTLENSLARQLRRIAGERGLRFKDAVNGAIAAGIGQMERPGPSRPYRTRPRPLGLRPGLSYDHVEELLSLVEGEAHR